MISTRLPERSPTTNSYPSLVGSMVMNDMVPSSFLREATALFHSPKSKVVAPFLLSTSIVPSSLLVYRDASCFTYAGSAGTTRRSRSLAIYALWRAAALATSVTASSLPSKTTSSSRRINGRSIIPPLSEFKSDIMFLPDSGIGAVVLTNSDNGGIFLRPFMRRLLEFVFDGNLEAVTDVASAAARHKAYIAKERERLVVPADPAYVKQLASRYTSKELGTIDVLNKNGATTFDFGEWKSAVASRKNDDGTISFITIDPTNDGYEFVVGERSGKRVLIIRDGQHEYLFTEAA